MPEVAPVLTTTLLFEGELLGEVAVMKNQTLGGTGNWQLSIELVVGWFSVELAGLIRHGEVRDAKQQRYRQSQQKRYLRKARIKAAIAKYISAPRIPQPIEE
jgi:hypothetical protein